MVNQFCGTQRLELALHRSDAFAGRQVSNTRPAGRGFGGRGKRRGRGEPVLGRAAAGVRWGPQRTPVVHGGHFRIMVWKQGVARGR